MSNTNINPAVLYVEDDPKSRIVLDMILMKRMKLSDVLIFEDSSNFVQRVQALPAPRDIILLDIHVKPYTGFEMLAMLREMEIYRNIPIVALTASVMNEEVMLLQTSGFNGCIAKPLNVQTFPALFERLLAGETIWDIS